MGMYHKAQQRNTRLQQQLTQQLDKHLTTAPKKPMSTDYALARPAVSFRWAFSMVFTSGGFVAILLAMIERQNTSAIAPAIDARTLAILGLASIIFGGLCLLIGRHGKTRHAKHA